MKRNLLIVGALGVVAAGCHTDMWVQPRTNPQGESDFYTDKQAARPLITGTVARGHLRENEAFYTGAENGKWIDRLPVPVTKGLLERGQERFDIFCSPCHGRLGDGQGMVAQRGFTLRRPVGNFHTQRLRELPVGHYFDVITNGYGAMYSYASRVEPADRWAIIAYIRTLQLSERATAADIGQEGLDAIANAAKPAALEGEAHGGEAHGNQ